VGLAVSALAAYLAVVVAANLVTTRYGLQPIGFGLMATAGTVFAGVALLARDAVQEFAGKRWVFAAIAVGSALSFWLGDGRIAFASAVAFLVAETLDLVVYTPIRKRSWSLAAGVSQIVGAVADTFIFLALAGFPVLAPVVTGQLVGKGYALLLIPVVVATRRVVGRRAVFRQPVHTEGA
jgi:uncharacterized PurR-regulated membrane protein YhhQ (DUF165 family)